MRLTEQEFAHYQAQREMQKRTLDSQIVNSPSRVEATTDKVESSPSKYRNKKTEVDGIVFASKKEANRYVELRTLERAGRIKNLQTQVPFVFEHEGVVICRYYADFTYHATNGQGSSSLRRIVEDVKGGKRTKEYIIKKKLMRAFYGIEILET